MRELAARLYPLPQTTLNAQALRYILDHSEAKACFVGKLDDTDSLAEGVVNGAGGQGQRGAGGVGGGVVDSHGAEGGGNLAAQRVVLGPGGSLHHQRGAV